MAWSYTAKWRDVADQNGDSGEELVCSVAGFRNLRNKSPAFEQPSTCSDRVGYQS
jgi:hypothetical protein